jgi:WD40 repeat protein
MRSRPGSAGVRAAQVPAGVPSQARTRKNHAVLLDRPGGRDEVSGAAVDRSRQMPDRMCGQLFPVLSPLEDRIVSARGGINIRNAETGAKVLQIESPFHMSMTVCCVNWNPMGDRIVSAQYNLHFDETDDFSIGIWDANTGERVLEIKHERLYCDVQSFAWNPTKDQITFTTDNTVNVWNTTTGTEVAHLKGHSDRVLSLCWSPDGNQLVSGSADTSLILWGENGDKIIEFRGHSDWVRCVAWHRNLIASASDDRTVIVWKIDSEEQILRLKGHKDGVCSVAWSPEGGRIVSASHDKTLLVWDSDSGNMISKIECPGSAVQWGNNPAVVSWSKKSGRIVGSFFFFGGGETCRESLIQWSEVEITDMRLAVALALHPRLGSLSILATLAEPGLIRAILHLVQIDFCCCAEYNMTS